MKARIHYLLAILFFCLCFGVCARNLSAAEVNGIKKIAYVDTVSKSLVLRFEDFSKKKAYTYTITSNENVIDEGDAPQNGVYALKGQYKEKTAYTIKVTDGKSTLTVNYYTGEGFDNLKAAQITQTIKAKWTVKDSSVYSGYQLSVLQKGAVKPQLSAEASGGDASVCKISASNLDSGDYSVLLTGCKTINKKKYFGKGISYSLTYVKRPAKVTGVAVKPNTNRVAISWSADNNAAYYRVYKAASAAGEYSLANDNVRNTSCTITGLSAGKKYYFKVEAVGAYKKKTIAGKQSAVKAATVPVVAGKVKGLEFALDSNDKLALKWKKTDKATGYKVYYKPADQKKYKKLGSTKKKMISLSRLTEDKDYQIVVYAVTKTGSAVYRSNYPSDVITLNPVKDMNKYYNKLLAKRVRSIGYIGTSRCVYTTKKYSAAVKTAFVNYKGYSSSTKYLIWISHYTQQVSVFEGKKGNWKMIRAFTVATGTAKNHSPRGVFKVGRKETGWYYVSTKELYVTHYCGRNSFHTRPLWNSGEVQNPTIGKPASHGCVRCYNSDARYIYNNMPRGTTVVSY